MVETMDEVLEIALKPDEARAAVRSDDHGALPYAHH